MKYILGKKIGMSQVFGNAGEVVPVTVIEAGPCVVTQVKKSDKDGYEAVQVGFGMKKHNTRPLQGHFKDKGSFRWVREFRVVTRDNAGPSVGDTITVSVFQEGDRVKVGGIAKGKGFQGVVKRHGFSGASRTHGTKHAHRQPGSIGATVPARVIKGMRMAGRMGGGHVTVRHVKVVKVDPENNLLALNGAVPGNRGTLVEIRGE